MTLGSDATNDMYYRNSSGFLTRFASANSGVLITSSGGVPSISSTIPTATQDNITRLGTIASIGAALGPAFGGTGVANNASATVTSSGNFAYTRTLTGATNVTFPTSGTLATLAGTETFTNKHITPQVQSVTDAGGTLTPVSITNDLVIATALSQATTIAAPTGSPNQGDKLMIRLKDNGTARALTWNGIYRVGTTVTLPTTTTLGKTLYCGFIYNSTDTKWDLVGYVDGI